MTDSQLKLTNVNLQMISINVGKMVKSLSYIVDTLGHVEDLVDNLDSRGGNPLRPTWVAIVPVPASTHSTAEESPN